MSKISVVINTLNEEKNIARALDSVKWANEVIVCDMYSEDSTVEIAKKREARVIHHKKTGYVEPARNFAISEAQNEWILVLDADEEISDTLKEQILQIISKDEASFVEIPRKNIIFGKWVKASQWWPDYHIRLFQKGKVTWSDKIHSKPKTDGIGLKIQPEESLAIIHHHYQDTSQYLGRMLNYSQIQAKELFNEGKEFHWQDLIREPLSEFLGRYFANKGYQDGMHGLALSLLQAISFLLVYIQLWEMHNFKEQEIGLTDFKREIKEGGYQINYWINFNMLSKNRLKRVFQKVINKVG